MGALLNPVERTRGFKWPFVVHTVAMFSFVTIYTAVNLNIHSTSYIDNRGFPGNEELPPGPLGYLFFSYSKRINIIPTLMFLFNNWLADGILVSPAYRSAAGCLTRAPPLALPVLRDLRHELQGHRFSLPALPWLFR